MKKRLLVAVGIASAACVGAIAMTPKPMLFAISDFGDASGQPVLAVMNPFRDRAPERAAEAVLSRLSAGETTAALRLVVGGVSPDVYAAERNYPLHSWRLVRRSDRGDTVELVYRTSRSPSQRAVMPLFLRVQRSNGAWRVAQFIVAY